MDPLIARKTWRTLEPIHGAIYFAAEVRDEYRGGRPRRPNDRVLRVTVGTDGCGDRRGRHRDVLQLRPRPGSSQHGRRVGPGAAVRGARRPLAWRRSDDPRPRRCVRRVHARSSTRPSSLVRSRLARVQPTGRTSVVRRARFAAVAGRAAPRALARADRCCASTAATGTSSPSPSQVSTGAKRSSRTQPRAMCRSTSCGRHVSEPATTGWPPRSDSVNEAGSIRTWSSPIWVESVASWIEARTDELAAAPYDAIGDRVVHPVA